MALSLTANLGLFKLARWLQRRELALHLDPLGTRMHPTGARIPRAAGTRAVLFYGDSRARSWPAPAGAPGFRFANRGIGGQTSVQILARVERDLLPLEPDVVVLELGVNDLKTLALLPDEAAMTLARCKQSVLALTRIARAHGMQVVLSTIFPLGKVPLYQRLDLTPRVDRGIVEVNDFLRGLRSEHVAILEADRALADADGRVRAEYAEDALHLAPAGYRALEPLLLEQLRALPPPTSDRPRSSPPP